MNRRDTVGAMRADDSKVSHPNLALGTLFHETYALNPSLISGKALSDLINQATIDFVDDLQMTRQHALKPGERPLLESFGQQCVIGVGQSPLCKVPGLVPTEMCFIEENPHQLRHRHRWMRIVKLNGNLVGKRLPVGVGSSEAAHEVGKRASDEKIFLHETQSLTHGRVVVGVKHPGQRFGLECLS